MQPAPFNSRNECNQPLPCPMPNVQAVIFICYRVQAIQADQTIQAVQACHAVQAVQAVQAEQTVQAV